MALPSPLASRLGAYAWLLTVSTRKSGRWSRVQVHWLWAALPSACDTLATLPGRYWLSRAGLIAAQAFGTERNSPGWNVVTAGLLTGGADLLGNGHVLVAHSTAVAIKATASTAPQPTRSLRRDFLALVAARRPRRA